MALEERLEREIELIEKDDSLTDEEKHSIIRGLIEEYKELLTQN